MATRRCYRISWGRVALYGIYPLAILAVDFRLAELLYSLVF